MLKLVGDRVSARKLRLYAVACCKHIWHLLTDKRSQKAVEAAEAYADELANREELEVAEKAARQVSRVGRVVDDRATSTWGAWKAALAAARAAGRVPVGVAAEAARAADGAASDAVEKKGAKLWERINVGDAAAEAERLYQAELVRDIFGSAIHPVQVARSWLRWNDGTIPKIAQAIYAERRFGDMPILADALEEAGCDNDDVLAHCRLAGEHVRGCWVVDLLLGKV